MNRTITLNVFRLPPTQFTPPDATATRQFCRVRSGGVNWVKLIMSQFRVLCYVGQFSAFSVVQFLDVERLMPFGTSCHRNGGEQAASPRGVFPDESLPGISHFIGADFSLFLWVQVLSLLFCFLRCSFLSPARLPRFFKPFLYRETTRYYKFTISSRTSAAAVFGRTCG